MMRMLSSLHPNSKARWLQTVLVCLAFLVLMDLLQRGLTHVDVR